MKVAILQDDFPPRHVGGAGAIAFASAKELQRRGHEVIVITTERKQEYAGVKEFEGLKVHTIISNYDFRFQGYLSLWNPAVVSKVRAILSEFKPDVVHAHRVHGYLSYASLVVAKKLGARVILSCHDVMPFNYNKLVETIDPNDLSIPEHFNYYVSPWRQMRDIRFRYNPIRNIAIRFIFRNYVDKILAVSHALKDALEQNGIKNVDVVHNGRRADDQPTSEEVNKFVEKYKLGQSAVFFTGKPISVKGGMKLLDALAIVKAAVPDVQLLVVGREDDQTERLIAHARKLGIEKKVIVTGWLAGELYPAAFAATALAAVPSLSFDSFPTANLDAMAQKKPVIATCFGGSKEVVQDGVTGYIVNPFDVKMLAQKIGELLSDRQKATHMGEQGYKRLTKEFTIEKQAETFEQYYRN